MNKKPVVLMILDGYGLNKNCDHNAVCEAKTPVMDQLMSQCPFVEGQASGLFVGLPDGQMGNSEVGHLNMGAGRVVYQELTRITKSIEDGDFFQVPEFLQAVENCKKNDSALHLFGLVSTGGVHSHLTHIYGLLELAKRNGLEKVYVHCFLDGRDTPPESGKDFVAQLEEKMAEIGVGKVASVMGRYYAMDRDKRWDRVELAYKALTKGEGKAAESATAGIQASYDDGKADEFVVPFVVTENGAPRASIKDGDSVVFFNFRPDRAREILMHSVTMSLTALQERKNWIWFMFALQTMTRPSQISWWHLRRSRSPIPSESFWLLTARSRYALPRQRSTLTLPSSLTAE